MSESNLSDNVLRAMTDDGAFRVLTVRTTDTVRRMLRAQSVWGAPAERLGELLTGAVLLRETMAPTHRLQSILRSPDGKTRWVIDSHPDGGTRGLLTRADPETVGPIAGGTLEVVRTLYNGELHRGVVAVPDGGGVSESFMVYLQTSEQVASMLAVACVLGEDRVVAAGGYLVQLLPEVGRGPLAIMAERLRDFQAPGQLLSDTDAATSPLLDELLYGMPFTRLEERPVEWKCQCSALRVISSLSTLPKADISALIEAGRPIELCCDFCAETYTVSPSQLSGLLEQS